MEISIELGKGVAAVAVEGGGEAAADAAQGTADAAALLGQQPDAEGVAFGFGPRRSRRPSDSMLDAQELHEPEPEPEPEPKPEPEPEP